MKNLIKLVLPIVLVFGCIGCKESVKKEEVVKGVTMTVSTDGMSEEEAKAYVEKNEFISEIMNEDDGTMTITMSIEKGKEWAKKCKETGKDLINSYMEGGSILAVEYDEAYENFIVRTKNTEMTEEEEKLVNDLEVLLRNIHSLLSQNNYQYIIQVVDETGKELTSSTGGIASASF